MASIFDVANYFLYRSNESEECTITPLKLQKLCYYAQAWSLAWDDKSLFPEKFEAWAHGPANSILYGKYKNYRWSEIRKLDNFDIAIFTKQQQETLNAVWEAYGIYDGSYLERLTHQEKPWIDARGDCKDGDYCDNEIPLNSMKEYFKSLLDG